MVKKTYSVEKSFILEAHNDACSDWKRKLEAKFPEIFAQSKEDKVKEFMESLESYPSYRGFKSYDFVEVDGYDNIVLVLPNYNTEWTLAAFALVKEICNAVDAGKLKGYRTAYPLHGTASRKPKLTAYENDLDRIVIRLSTY